MYRIRFHGRGGQGMKTASRVLGTALFREGFEVQDAPRYGGERRGAPIFAYVRAAREPIAERGVIRRPDLVVVADDSCMAIPAAKVRDGLQASTVVLVFSHQAEESWADQLVDPRAEGGNSLEDKAEGAAQLVRLAAEAMGGLEPPYVGVACAGAAARLLGVVSREALEQAIRDEMGGRSAATLDENLQHALRGYDEVAEQAGCVSEGESVDAGAYARPHWVDLPFEEAWTSAPTIRASGSSEAAKTGLWRTTRPVIDRERCGHCWWVCSHYCPDGAIAVPDESEEPPRIDYAHCKGCMICLAMCPWHAIEAVAEDESQAGADGGESVAESASDEAAPEVSS